MHRVSSSDMMRKQEYSNSSVLAVSPVMQCGHKDKSCASLVPSLTGSMSLE